MIGNYKPRLLATILNGLRMVMSDKEIINLLSPKNVQSGLKILAEMKGEQ